MKLGISLLLKEFYVKETVFPLNGVKKLLPILIAPDIREHYDNMKMIMDLINVNDAECIVTCGDKKLQAIMTGLIGAASRFNCNYCETDLTDLEFLGPERTFGSIRSWHERFVDAGAR